MHLDSRHHARTARGRGGGGVVRGTTRSVWGDVVVVVVIAVYIVDTTTMTLCLSLSESRAARGEDGNGDARRGNSNNYPEDIKKHPRIGVIVLNCLLCGVVSRALFSKKRANNT